VKGAGGRCAFLHVSTAIVDCLTAGIKLSILRTYQSLRLHPQAMGGK
jgi:hypothetical protein